MTEYLCLTSHVSQLINEFHHNNARQNSRGVLRWYLGCGKASGSVASCGDLFNYYKHATSCFGFNLLCI